MSTSALCRVYGSGGQFHQGIVWDAVQDLETYLDNSFSDHSFYSFDLGVIPGGVDCTDYSQDQAGEKAFVEDVLLALKNEGELFPDDHVVISHGCAGFGYGGGESYIALDGGGRAWANAVYAGTGAQAWEVRGFTWHEQAHLFDDAWHDDAEYVVTDGLMHSITPLAMAYLHTADGDPDTHFSATNNSPSGAPSEFCFGEPNFTYDGYQLNKEAAHDLGRFALCTRNHIGDWIAARQ